MTTIDLLKLNKIECAYVLVKKIEIKKEKES